MVLIASMAPAWAEDGDTTSSGQEIGPGAADYVFTFADDPVGEQPEYLSMPWRQTQLEVVDSKWALDGRPLRINRYDDSTEADGAWPSSAPAFFAAVFDPVPETTIEHDGADSPLDIQLSGLDFHSMRHRMAEEPFDVGLRPQSVPARWMSLSVTPRPWRLAGRSGGGRYARVESGDVRGGWMPKSLQFVRRIWTHPANHEHRLRQLAHGVRYQLDSRRGSEFVTPLGDRSRLFATRDHASSSLAVYSNPPDVGEVRAWKKLLGAGDLFVDVGANVGVYTVLMAEHGCEVVAAEPDAVARAMLKRNLALNGYQAEVVDCVLADKLGTRRFTHGLDSTNHIVVDGESTVRALTLDLLLGDRAAAGVKIDVEGAEHLVLEGARQALSERRIRALQLEWNEASEANFGEPRESALRTLREYGYTTFRPSVDGDLYEDPCPTLGTNVFAIAAP